VNILEKNMMTDDYSIILPDTQSQTLDQDAEYCILKGSNGAGEQRIRFHDYEKIYSIPGLYERLFYKKLKCTSPSTICGYLKEVVGKNNSELRNLRVLDLGAGNGMVGEELSKIGVEKVYGIDIVKNAKKAVERDRPDIYRKYFRCLKQRNLFLKEDNNQNDYWLDQLIEYGSKIISERIKFINKINSFFKSDNFKKINSEEYFISYSKKYTDTESIRDSLKQEFIRKENRERQLGYTLIGPHKDDIVFYLNDRPADSFASQGQKRSMVISFKTAQILDYKAVQGHYPVLILDDMTSELDSNRRNVLLENLLDNSGQVFITSTDFKQTSLFEQSKVFKVNNGEISVAD